MIRDRLRRAAQRYHRVAVLYRWARRHRRKLVSAFVVFAHIAGALTSVRAVMEPRTPQGAIAWAVSLNTFPYVAVPAYWFFGTNTMEGYALAREATQEETDPIVTQLVESLEAADLVQPPETPSEELLSKLANLPITGGNKAELFIDGQETFEAIFADIAAAKQYVLVQFYILRDDQLGQQLADALVAKAAEGVEVYLLFDGIGSHSLGADYLERLDDAGVRFAAFNVTQGEANSFQVNFRNHRKLVVVDGRIGYVGGLNVGVEYLRSDWRDTMVRVEGPIALCIQVPFLEDWRWATGTVPHFAWSTPSEPSGSVEALCLPSGPADLFPTCAFFFLDAISQARARVWIASPYFVPDEQMVSALQLAALRGVDVRILIPERTDSLLPHLSSFSYLAETEKAGVKVFRYPGAFMHQKAILVDDDLAGIGTANFDNRSFRLNFEITLVFPDRDFADEVEAMFNDDFAASREAGKRDLESRSFLFRLAVRISRLLAPIQ